MSSSAVQIQKGPLWRETGRPRLNCANMHSDHDRKRTLTISLQNISTDSKGAGQAAHLRSLACAFVVRICDKDFFHAMADYRLFKVNTPFQEKSCFPWCQWGKFTKIRKRGPVAQDTFSWFRYRTSNQTTSFVHVQQGQLHQLQRPSAQSKHEPFRRDSILHGKTDERRDRRITRCVV